MLCNIMGRQVLWYVTKRLWCILSRALLSNMNRIVLLNDNCNLTCLRENKLLLLLLLLLPPAYVVRREGNSFTLFVSPHLGGTHIP